MDRGLWDQDSAPCRATRGTSHRFPDGLPMVGRAGLHDAQDADDEQGSQDHVCADEDSGEGSGHDVEGCRGGLGQWGEEAGEGAGEGAEHEGGAAARPDAGAERRSCRASWGSSVSPTMPRVSVECHALFFYRRSYLPRRVTPALDRYPRPDCLHWDKPPDDGQEAALVLQHHHVAHAGLDRDASRPP